MACRGARSHSRGTWPDWFSDPLLWQQHEKGISRKQDGLDEGAGVRTLLETINRTGLLIGFRSEREREIEYDSQVSGLGNWLDGWMYRHRIQEKQV